MNKPRLVFGLRISIALGALTTLFFVADVERVASSLGRVDGAWFTLGLAVAVAAVAINAVKWQVLLRAIGLRARLTTLVRLTFASILYGTVLPGQIAGDGVRIVRLMRRHPTQRPAAAMSVLFDRVTGVYGLLLVGLVAAVSDPVAPPVVVTSMWVLALATTLGGVLVVTVGRRLAGMPGQSRNRRRAVMFSLLAAVGAYRRAWRSAVASIVISMFVHLVSALAVLAFARSLGIVEVGLASAVWITSFIVMVMYVPVSIAAVGPREGAFVLLLSLYDIGAVDALSLSMLMLVSLLVTAGIGGVSELMPDDMSLAGKQPAR